MTQIQALWDAIRQVRLKAPFHIVAGVVLPDHMRCLWTLPAGDADLPGRWRAIKKAFSKALPAREPRSPALTSRGERGIWHRRYREHTIGADRDLGGSPGLQPLQPGKARSWHPNVHHRRRDRRIIALANFAKLPHGTG